MFSFTAETQRTLRRGFSVCPALAGQTETVLPLQGIFPAERLQSWPEEVLWRIGICRFSINNLPLCELSVPNESCFQRDKWAVKFDTTYLLL